MADMTSLTLAHLPPHKLHIALFTNVTNAAALRAELLAANPAFDYALIDARLLLGPTHLLAAAFRALSDAAAARLRARTVHAEIVLSLAPGNNIASALRTFGVGEATTALLAVKVVGLGGSAAPAAAGAATMSAEDVQAHLVQNVEGTLTPFTPETMAAISDIEAIRKAYKVPEAKGARKRDVDGLGKDGLAADERASLEVTILGMMALRGS